MSNVSYLLPKHQRPVWPAELEDIGLELEQMTEIPLLGMVTAGRWTCSRPARA